MGWLRDKIMKHPKMFLGASFLFIWVTFFSKADFNRMKISMPTIDSMFCEVAKFGKGMFTIVDSNHRIISCGTLIPRFPSLAAGEKYLDFLRKDPQVKDADLSVLSYDEYWDGYRVRQTTYIQDRAEAQLKIYFKSAQYDPDGPFRSGELMKRFLELVIKKEKIGSDKLTETKVIGTFSDMYPDRFKWKEEDIVGF